MRVTWGWVIVFSAMVAIGQQAGEKISGTVVDSTGAVIAGVNVFVSGPDKRSVRTDQLGGFSIPDLKSGTYVMRLESPGFKFPARDIVLKGGQNQSLSLVMQVRQVACPGEWMPAELDRWRSDDGTTSLVGRIVNRTAGIAVTLRDTHLATVMAEKGTVIAETVTDDRGEFEFSKLVPGTYKLEITWEGRTWVGAEQLSVQADFVTEAYMGWGAANCITAH